jgi:hypothetical protein
VGGQAVKNIILVGSILFLSGCVTMNEETKSTGSFPRELKSIAQMRMVATGMYKQEVRSILDEKVTIGYEQGKDGQTYLPLTLNNPYRFETLKSGDRVFEVYYYFIGIKQTDGQISNDELLPLVFENDRLIGKGWSFLAESVQAPG